MGAGGDVAPEVGEGGVEVGEELARVGGVGVVARGPDQVGLGIG